MEINLTQPQSEVFADDARFKVLICGRRFGKTFLAIVWLLSNAIRSHDGSLHYYIARISHERPEAGLPAA